MQHGPYEHKLQRQTSIYIKGKFSGKNSTTAFAAGDERDPSRREQAMSDVDPCFVLKVTKKIRKNLGLIPLRKKLAAAAAAAAAMQRAVAGVVQISKHCVRISPRILTTDPQPCLRADAVSDLLSVSEFAICFLT